MNKRGSNLYRMKRIPEGLGGIHPDFDHLPETVPLKFAQSLVEVSPPAYDDRIMCLMPTGSTYAERMEKRQAELDKIREEREAPEREARLKESIKRAEDYLDGLQAKKQRKVWAEFHKRRESKPLKLFDSYMSRKVRRAAAAAKKAQAEFNKWQQQQDFTTRTESQEARWVKLREETARERMYIREHALVKAQIA